MFVLRGAIGFFLKKRIPITKSLTLLYVFSEAQFSSLSSLPSDTKKAFREMLLAKGVWVRN